MKTALQENGSSAPISESRPTSEGPNLRDAVLALRDEMGNINAGLQLIAGELEGIKALLELAAGDLWVVEESEEIVDASNLPAPEPIEDETTTIEEDEDDDDWPVSLKSWLFSATSEDEDEEETESDIKIVSEEKVNETPYYPNPRLKTLDLSDPRSWIQEREVQGLTQVEVAEKLGISHWDLRRYENSKRPIPLEVQEKFRSLLEEIGDPSGNPNIPTRWRVERKFRNVKQQKVAKLLGVSTDTLSRIERGMSQPSEDMRESLNLLFPPE